MCGPHTKIAFISCPTAYVGFQYEHHVPGARLFEYDTRFRTFAGDAFVHYDLHEPEDNLPQDMLGQTNIAVVDPPFLNRVTNENVARTLKKLMRNDGKLVLLTSTSVRDEVQEVYKNVVGGLKETQIKVEHAGGISNEFACWTNVRCLLLFDDGSQLSLSHSGMGIGNAECNYDLLFFALFATLSTA